jgi:TolB-like protein
MKTRRSFARCFSVVALICVVCAKAVGAPSDGMTLDAAISAFGKYLASRIPKDTVVVVSNFSASTGNLSDYVIEELTTILIKNDRLRVAARGELELLQREMDFQFSGEVSDETQQTIGYKLGASTVISGSLSPLGSAFLMRIKAINVESAVTQASESYTIRRDERLIALLDSAAGSTVRSKTWSDFHLDIGARVGVSSRFYTLSDDIMGAASDGASFEGAGQVSAAFLSFNLLGFPVDVAAQTEVMFTHDTVNYTTQNDDGDHSGSFSYLSLRIPVFAALVVGFGERFSLSVFTGPHFTIPLEEMSYTVDGNSTSFSCSVPWGWTVGMQVWVALGSGSVVGDLRYAGDFGRTSIDGAPGTLPIFSRELLSFSAGYKFRLRF